MTIPHRARNAALVLSVLMLAGGTQRPAEAGQSGGGALRLAQQDPGDDTGDASATVLRIGQLEEQVRTLTGQVEQLQFQNRKLDENLRKMQADVDFRFQDLQHPGAAGTPTRPAAPQKRSDAEADSATPPDLGPASATVVPGALETARPRRTGDAFDPDLDPSAPGAPKPLGTTPASQPIAPRGVPRNGMDTSRAPLDLMQRPPATAADAEDTVGAPDTPSIIAAPAAVPRLPDPNAVASLVPGGTREEYDADLGLYKQGQYDGAATGFQAFADKYPKDRLVPDAVYLAGESFARLGRHREAAEQFLKVSTDYGKSARAPDALLRLGMSLNALGAKEQACATYLEVTRRYPAASADVRSGVDRELKRARCSGNG